MPVVPSPHNLTVLGNMTGIVELTQTVNTSLMHGWFGVLSLATIFGILMFSFMAVTNSGSKSFLAAIFISFLLSLPLRILGLVPDLVLFSLLGLTAFAVAIIKVRE